MKILVVVDEAPLREFLVAELKQRAFAVDACNDGADALYQGTEYDYDLAIIDLGLPHIDGISLIKQLRAKQRRFPIMVLTARSHWQEKVDALNAGADDYVVKPFQIEEVQARIDALIRRSSGHSTAKLQFGSLCLDTSSRTASLNNQAIELTSYEYNTLEYLARNSGRVISKTELTEHLYEQDYDRDSNVIEVFVGRLRKKLDPGNTLKPIATIRRQGYRFTLAADHEKTG
jgi:two-component system response regulator PhoP